MRAVGFRLRVSSSTSFLDDQRKSLSPDLLVCAVRSEGEGDRDCTSFFVSLPSASECRRDRGITSRAANVLNAAIGMMAGVMPKKRVLRQFVNGPTERQNAFQIAMFASSNSRRCECDGSLEVDREEQIQKMFCL